MNYNKMIDHTLLKPDATPDKIVKLCGEAKEYGFASVCVNGCYVRLAAQELKDSGIDVCTVVGFPLGAMASEAKLKETEIALKDGATEVDMVINIGRLIAQDNQYVENEIRSLKKACGNKVLKVIIETCLLTDEQKVRACQLAVAAGADFVKTSTGFSTGGANVHDIALMRKTVGPNIGVKASGGIHTHEQMVALVEAGATRIGASSGPQII
ncbi:MAG TPA: deoxyribose-phosphate aldolase [Bacilli bacterium]|nr:deoxyribose-phosphate aldolase [Bacilli bacterium]